MKPFQIITVIVCTLTLSNYSYSAPALNSPSAPDENTTYPSDKLAYYKVPPGDPILYLPYKQDAPALTSTDVGTTPAAPVLYVAPFGITGRDSTTETQSFRHLIRFHLTPGTFTATRWFNIVPDVWTDMPYEREDGKDKNLVRPRETYLRDAALLQADYYLDGHLETTSGGLTCRLYCRILSSGQEKEFIKEYPVWTREIVSQAVTQVSTFLGHSTDDIEKSGLLNGVPGPSWDFLRDDRATAPAEFVSEAALDPDCLFLYRRAAERLAGRSIDFINAGLARHGKDARMVFAKSWAVVSNNRGHAGMVLQAPLVRQWPQCLVYLGSYMNSLDSCYDNFRNCYAPPPDYVAFLDSFEKATRIWPQNWGLHMMLSEGRRNLASHVRGSDTMDKVHDQATEIHGKLNELAVKDILVAVEGRHDCPKLLDKALRVLFSAGNSELDEQRKLLDHILAIDPSNTSAEDTIAYSHSAGWDDPRVGLSFISAQLEKRKDNPRAVAGLFSSFSTALKRIFSFDITTPDDFIKPGNEIITKFIETGEKVLQSGQPVTVSDYSTLILAYQKLKQEAKAESYAGTNKDPIFTASYAVSMRNKKDFESALKHSLAAQNGLTRASMQIANLEVAFDSLLGLKRNTEALKHAEKSLAQHPDSAKGYHMVARALEELNQDLKRAVILAEKAVQRSPGSDEYVNTLRRIQKKAKKDDSPN